MSIEPHDPCAPDTHELRERLRTAEAQRQALEAQLHASDAKARESEARFHAATRALQRSHAELESQVHARTAEIAKTAALLSSAFEATADGILAVDLHGNVTAINQRLLEILRIEAMIENINVPTVMQRWATERLADADAFLARTILPVTRADAPDLDVLAFKDGRYVEVVSRPQVVDGVTVGRVFSFRDLSERRRVEQQANRAQRLEALGTLAGGIAHDLNNALAPIIMVLGNLRDEYPERAHELEVLEASAARATGMVRQLLTFARGSDGRSTSIDAAPLLAELETIIRATFPKNITVTVRCDPSLPPFRGDPTLAHQLLLNLCVNARDAMPHGGHLTITAAVRVVNVGDDTVAMSGTKALPGSYVCLKVRDTGMGIPTHVMDRMFEPFFTTKDPDKGTGLGLSTVVGIVKGCGGFVQIESEVGRGTWVCACLPMELEHSEAMSGSACCAERFTGRGETVLFVDDEASVREAARITLERLNVTPLLAADGMDGLTHVYRHHHGIRAIITDMNMPHMDGMRLVRAVRQMRPDMPIIAASGRVDEGMREGCAALGVDLFLEKPFTEQQLSEVLARALPARAEASLGP